MERTIRDAAGRTVQAGDTVGGTTGIPQSTVIGYVVEVSYSRLRLIVTSVSTSHRNGPKVGTELWMPGRRAFLIHANIPQVQTVRATSGHVTSLRWTGKASDLPAAVQFAGADLIGALDGEDGWTLFLRTSKARSANPDAVLPGWFILRPPVKGRHRGCDPATYASSYAPIATEHTPDPEETS